MESNGTTVLYTTNFLSVCRYENLESHPKRKEFGDFRAYGVEEITEIRKRSFRRADNIL
jgi:hypothetical protein